MKNVAIIYHSGYGHTEVQAKHVYKGASSVDGVQADLFRTTEAIEKLEHFNKYDAMIFGTPTYMGSASAEFKAFMEATSKLFPSQTWKNKLAAGFTNSGSLSGDKFNTLMQLVTFACQHSMLWMSLGELNESNAKEKKSGDFNSINRVGSSIGAVAQSDPAPPDETPAGGDLLTAERLGQRVAKATLMWNG